MFRKIYKQANDDIKPSEDMINRVILNAHKGAEKRQSPLPYRRYAKYAVSAAAAVAVCCVCGGYIYAVLAENKR